MAMVVMLSSPCLGLVKVYDRVFDVAACAELHRSASARGLGHALYTRAHGPRLPLEHAFESYLASIGDGAPVVEYWSRQEWRHIEAHRDVDEALAAGGGPQRCPEHGHVMYLRVGEKVRGPTCVWEPGDSSSFGALTSVPAVEGRVLRFAGDLQHAVPRPMDVWLSPFTVSQSGRAEDFVRSVVLFNTWPDASAPPLNVECDEALHDFGAEVSARWLARPRSEWRAAALHAPPPTTTRDGAPPPTTTMKLWLLGDTARRAQRDRTLKLAVDGQAVAAALAETRHCTRVPPAA